MAFTLLQVGTTLKSINSTGAFSPTLTLPAGVVLSAALTPRFARFNRYVILVNTPSRPLSIGDDGVVRLLTPNKPTTPVALTAPDAGGLTGTYLALETYKLLDSNGNVVSESDYGPFMPAAVAIANNKLLANFPLSTDAVDGIQLYRTTTLGATYFPWLLIPGNLNASVEDDTPDAGLGVIQGAFLGTPPDLTLIAEFGGRLWGVDRTDIDDLRYTEAGTMYAWSALNTLPIQHLGSDSAGITALIPRRNSLGVARLNVFNAVTGTDRTNFTPNTVNGGESVGCVSQESVVVYNDVAYFLWRDGVYMWNSTGISPISNGLVRSWFTTDKYFNRSMFWRAFAQLDPIGLKYRLFLPSVGSNFCDRWIEYDLTTQTWWGPHKTDAFQPTCAILVAGSDQQPYYMVGGIEGYLSQDQNAKNDWNVNPIVMSGETVKQIQGEPELEKYWGELAISQALQPTTGNLTITPVVGEIDDNTVPQAPFTVNPTVSYQRLGRLGRGKRASLIFNENTLNQDVVIYGYEIDPISIIGRR